MIYIGKHSTNDVGDGYLGSNVPLQKDIGKYGKDNFRRDILCFCVTEQEALDKERKIVDEEFVARKDTYNLNI